MSRLTLLLNEPNIWRGQGFIDSSQYIAYSAMGAVFRPKNLPAGWGKNDTGVNRGFFSWYYSVTKIIDSLEGTIRRKTKRTIRSWQSRKFDKQNNLAYFSYSSINLQRRGSLLFSSKINNWEDQFDILSIEVQHAV